MGAAGYLVLLYSLMFDFHAGIVVVPDSPAIFSQYGPWIDGDKMYFCRNSNHGGWNADRVWQADYIAGEVVNPKIILQGSPDPRAEDFLTCTGAAVDGHIFYMTSAADSSLLGVSHAYYDGKQWIKTGRVVGITAGAWVDTPSIVTINGIHYLYIVENERLTRYKISGDYLSVSDRMRVSSARAIHGTVAKMGGKYYYTYSDGKRTPTDILLSESFDPAYFGRGRKLFSSQSGWDGLHAFTPVLVARGKNLLVYYAGNSRSVFWWGQDSSIGARLIGGVDD